LSVYLNSFTSISLFFQEFKNNSQLINDQTIVMSNLDK
jgi:hypothetical protein